VSAPVTIGLVGFGYWGPNLARNISTNSATELVAICEVSPERRAAASLAFPDVRITDAVSDLIGDPVVEAIVIATPTESHFALAKMSLQAGKHTFVEKPLTRTAAQAGELVEIAARSGLVLHVDHTFVYTPAVEYLATAIEQGDLGELLYFDSSRVNLGLFQPDVDVLWDLAVHDLSILQELTRRTPRAVSACGVFHPRASQASAAFLTLSYDNHFVAHIDVSWMSPVKFRRTLISGSTKMAVYDDLEVIEKVKIFDAGVEFPDSVEGTRDVLVSYRTGDMVSPNLKSAEALTTEVTHFADCVRSGVASRTDGEQGAALIRILEAASVSMSKGGVPTLITVNEEAR